MSHQPNQTHRRLLLLSNSTNYGAGYLAHAQTAITDFLGPKLKRVLFVPYAGVRFSYAAYAETVRASFAACGYELDALNGAADPRAAVAAAAAIAVGGGNTFELLRQLYAQDLLSPLRARIAAGVPYIGWSAGANVAGPSIKTTNDMPIVEPPSFAALNLVPFQINPHYTDAHPAGHKGETRAERITEFTLLNPGVHVVGLPEGSLLRIEGQSVKLAGDKPARVFHSQTAPRDYQATDALDFLLHTPA